LILRSREEGGTGILPVDDHGQDAHATFLEIRSVKTLSLEMEICRQNRNHDVAWLAELDWDNDVGRYSSRPVAIGAFVYRPIIAAINNLQLAMPSIIPGDGANDRTVKIELVNTAEEGGDRFEIKADSQGLEGRTVRVGFVFLDPDIVLDPTDIIWIQTYAIEAVVLETAKAVLQLRESPVVAGRRLIGRRLLASLDPSLSAAAMGRMIPLIFGRIERSPLIPFRVGRRGCLRQALQPEDKLVAVEDATVFPDTGTVQVDDETIIYAAVDRVGRTLGRADSPVIRTSPAHHRAGAAIDWIPENGFEYLATDHPCHLVGPIYSGERLVDPARYFVAVEQLDGREVQKVVFPRLPSEVNYGSILQWRRIDGREDENLWGIGAGNDAQDALSAVDGAGQVTAAVLSTAQTPLEIEYLGDLSAGTTIYGPIHRCRLCVEFSASQRWSVANEVNVAVGRGADSGTFVLNRPPLSETLATFPAHSHADTIRDQMSDMRELFEIAQQCLVTEFDEALASGGGWTNSERAIDGNLGTWTQNTTPGGPRITLPLAFRLARQPLAGTDGIALEAIEFHVRLATDEGTPVVAALDAAIAGKYVDSWTVEAAATPQTCQCAITAQGLAVEDLIAPTTEFAVRSVDGRQIKVFGAWLRLKYRPRIAGRERTASQWRSGSVEAAAPVPVALPTKSYRQEFDLTNFIQSHGGWGFFAPESDERPFVRIAFGSSDDLTSVRISAIGFEIAYAPRTSVEVFDQFDATVEGVEESGELVANPADIIEWLITNPAGLNWPSETLDADSFAQAHAWLEGRDWRLSRRIAAPMPIFSLLEEVAQESGCRLYWEAGRLRLRPVATVLLPSEAVATLDSSLILSAPLAKRVAPLGGIANVIRVRYGTGSGAGSQSAIQWLEMADAGSSAAAWGRCEREFHTHWLASSPAEMAAGLAALWLSQTAQPPRTVEVSLPISQSHLERGDIVIVDHPSSRLDGAMGQIVAIEFADGRHVRATIALQTTAMYCWYDDAETFIVHLAAHTDKVFVIEGARVAALDRTGQLRLRGEVVEQGLPVRAMSVPIEHDPDTQRLYFGVGNPSGGYAAVFALDANGRLILRGTAREQADLSSLVLDTCHRADPTRFLFSCDLASVVFDYEAGADRLDLAGRVVENAPL
jgi:hypothetical protein